MKIATFALVKKSFADILSGLDDKKFRKLCSKIPEWASAKGIEVPGSLALEQCSSSATASYKASLAGRPGVVVDITGGLGVDSWAFSRVAGKVFYLERNPELAGAAMNNFTALGLDNVTVRNECVSADSTIPDCDLIYADPARRSDTGRKVFLLEDCTPDILSLLPMLWRHSSRIMLKLSPMADIGMVAQRLGEQLKEVHVTGHEGECKELLCIMEKGHSGGYSITVADLDSGSRLSFTPEDERGAEVRYTRVLRPGQYLFEPSAALMKSGCFRLLSERFGMEKMSKDTHLYISDNFPEAIAAMGKTFVIEDVRKLDKNSMRELGKAHPRAEVSARGIPMRSEDLRDRLGCKSGGSCHIFGCSAQVTLPEGMVGLERMLVLGVLVPVHPIGIDH